MKKTPWLVLLILMAILVIALVLFRNKAEAPTSPTSSTTTNSVTKELGQGSTAKYIDYSDNAIASNPGKKVLFFHAKWCPQCRSIESDILAGPLPESWTIIKVDYDNSQSLRQKYGVTLQTTFVKVDGQGEQLSKFVAYEEPNLAAIKQNFLDK
ncbi:MAG: thioredoxin family protein [Patescibacteria group bacterium]